MNPSTMPDAILARQCRQLRLVADHNRAAMTWRDISLLIACEAEAAYRDINVWTFTSGR